MNALQTQQAKMVRLASFASVSIAVFLLSLKAYAALQTASMALWGSLADSALDVLASVITFLAVSVAAKPADAEHRYGHGKAEGLSALLQTALIGFSGLLLLYESAQRLHTPTPIAAPELGITVSVIAIFLTLFLIIYQNYVIKKTQSLAIRLDAAHYKSDLLLNLSVILALSLESHFQVTRADAAAGMAIGCYLVYGAWTSAQQALDMLMDREWPEAERQAVLHLAGATPGVVGVHHLRTRKAGFTDFVEMCIHVKGTLSVIEGHSIADRVEQSIQSHYPRAHVLIHVEPAIEPTIEPDATTSAAGK